MNTAIDFYSRGKEKEAEANEYTLPGYYPLGRFICPECGEEVFLSRSKYKKKQVKYYDQYYDRNIVVVGSTHATHITEHVPGWWGIISVELIGNRMDFYAIREAQDNPKNQEDKKITILWRPELNRLLEVNGLPAYKQKSKAFVQKKLLERVLGELLWPQVMDELFERDYYTIGDEIEAYRRR